MTTMWTPRGGKNKVKGFYWLVRFREFKDRSGVRMPCKLLHDWKSIDDNVQETADQHPEDQYQNGRPDRIDLGEQR